MTPNIASFKINNDDINFTEVSNDKYFNILLKSTDIHYNYFYLYSGRYFFKEQNNTGYSFGIIEKEVNNNFTYKEREDSIKARNEGKISRLKEEISTIKNKIATVESESLTGIFQEIGIDEFINDTPIDIPLIRNLLLNGYINENYNDYISIFHGINMTSKDFSFIRKVKSGTKHIFDESLTNIDQIIKKLHIRYFKNEAIFNFDLLDYILKNRTSHQKQYKSIIDLIKKETENSLKFMDEYISSQREHIPFFVQELSANWDSFWDYIYEHPSFDDSKKDNYLLLILRHAKLDSIHSLNKKDQLAQYIENHEQFLSLLTDSKDFDKIVSVIKKLSIHLNSLEFPKDDNEKLFNFIYENDYYSLNTHNITLLVKKYITIEEEVISGANYTTILDSDCEPLKNYIHKFLANYLEQVFLKLPNNIHESEETILLLLNNNDLPIELRAKIIDKQVSKITDNSNSEYLEIDTLLFQKNKIQASWSNIINYFEILEEKIIDDALITFLNIEENYKALNNQSIDKKNEVVEDLEVQLICSNQLSIEAYKSVVIKMPYNWNSINFSNLDLNKVEWLIGNKLNLTKRNLDVLRSHFGTLSIKLMEKKSQELITKYDDLELNINDHIEILQSASIGQTIKEK